MRLQCVCGKVLNNVPDSLSGQKIRCKDCGKVLTVRPSGEVDAVKPFDVNDPLAVRNYRPCPRCGRSWPTKDKVCTACGTDMSTGAALYTSLDASGDALKRKQEEGRKKKGLVARLLRLLGKKGS
jgi:ribosomal protein L37E